MLRFRVILAAAIVAVTAIPAVSADFDPRVVTFGAEREQIKNTPIEKRPNRPLHVYGNSVRRRQGRTAQSAPKGDARR
jgi:hypothetical protein